MYKTWKWIENVENSETIWLKNLIEGITICKKPYLLIHISLASFFYWKKKIRAGKDQMVHTVVSDHFSLL